MYVKFGLGLGQWGVGVQKTGLRNNVLENFGIEIRHFCQVLQKPSQKEGLLPLIFATQKPLKIHAMRKFAKLTTFATFQNVFVLKIAS